MNNAERLKAGIDQIHPYGERQFTEWRVDVVKSIQKILLNLDDFYSDLITELEEENDTRDLVYCQIRNGWPYEAVAQAEQAIEDLFSTMMNLNDIAYFAKNVIRYNASDAKSTSVILDQATWSISVSNKGCHTLRRMKHEKMEMYLMSTRKLFASHRSISKNFKFSI